MLIVGGLRILIKCKNIRPRAAEFCCFAMEIKPAELIFAHAFGAHALAHTRWQMNNSYLQSEQRLLTLHCVGD